ncbi:MAG: 5-carboxymethyl-2-hydroxymuconate isomerase, partial [Burkholderiales bacterium]|nr:5-carboxymethyl-2-hydroxymuconate isomerase [Burkholderiales bacterium]
MKLLSFKHKGRESWGAQVGDGASAAIIDLGRETSYATLQAFIASPDFARRDDIVRGKAATIPVAEISYLPVIPKPDKIVLLVRNYLDHHQEVVAA